MLLLINQLKRLLLIQNQIFELMNWSVSENKESYYLNNLLRTLIYSNKAVKTHEVL